MIRKKIVKYVIVVLLVGVIFFSKNLLLSASSSDLNYIDLLSEEYTSSDKYVYNSIQIDIDDYKTTWNGYNGVGRGEGYGQRNVASGSSYRFDDNDIVNIIPKDLFFMVGEYHYLGEEYGFYICTEDNNYTYRSCVLVYDVDYTIPNYYASNSTCEIRVLFQCWYDGMDRNKSALGNLIVSEKDRAVVFLYNDDSLYLKNLSVGVDLENRDELNYGDENYQLIDYTNFDILDKGDYISYQEGYVVPKELPAKLGSNPDYELNTFEQILMIGMKNVLDKIGLEPILWLEKLQYFNVDENEDGKYDAFKVLQDFASGYDQVLEKEEFVRGAVCSTRSQTDDYNAKICVDGKFRVFTKFEGPIKVSERNYMKLNYDLSVTVVNEENNSTSTVTNSREFVYSKKMHLINKDEVQSAEIDQDLDNTAFFFRSTENQNLYFCAYGSENLSIKIYDNDGTLISSGINTILLGCLIDTSYIIIIDGEKNSKVIFNISETSGKYTSIDANNLNNIYLELEESNYILNIGNEEDGVYCFDFKSFINSNLLITIEDIEGNIIESEFEISLEQKYFAFYLNENNVYIIKIKNQELSNGSIHINIFNTAENMVNLNCLYNKDIDLTNEMVSNSYITYKNLYYINNRNAGFYNFELVVKNEDGEEIYLPQNSINIFNYNDDELELQYNVSGYQKSARNVENENGICAYLSRKGYFYLHILIPSGDYSEITLKVTSVDYQEIDIMDKMEEEFVETIITENMDYDYVKQIEINQTAKYRININIDSLENVSNIRVLMLKNIYNSSTNTYYKVDQFCIEINKLSDSIEISLTPGLYYIGYFDNSNENKISITFERELQINSYSYSAMITDPDSVTLCGSEVNLNNGLYRGNTITEGFTRYIYLNNTGGISNSRTDYYWYSSNDSVATVSGYGTVLAKNVGSDTTIKIYAVYKNDPSIIFIKTFIIKVETNTEEIIVPLTMTVNLNETKSINLGNSAPYNFLQYYSWYSDDTEIATVDYFGRVSGVSKGQTIIWGKYYIYNERVTIKIIVNII